MKEELTKLVEAERGKRKSIINEVFTAEKLKSMSENIKAIVVKVLNALRQDKVDDAKKIINDMGEE